MAQLYLLLEAVLEEVQEERSLPEIVEMVSDRVNLVVTEGYRGAAALKIEVSREAHTTHLTARLDDLLAIVTDHAFDLDVVGLADDHREPALAFEEARQLVQADHQRAGRIVDGEAAPLQIGA